ncbi:MAG: proton-conducting transporter membrane subunit [Euryarchaeota archaeon]|nr:proton-conducting transporter membrane subunit [Euryarchaeota archaeon]
MINEHLPALIIAVPLLAAFATPLISKIDDKLRNIFVIGVMGVVLYLVGLLALEVFDNGIFVYTMGGSSPGIPLPSGHSMPVRIVLEVDGMSIFMGVITAIVAFVGAIYSWGFIGKETGKDKYYTLLLLLTAGMFGMEFTGDMFNFFVFLEVTSIAACGLVGFRIYRGESVEAAFKTMVLYTLGALLVLFAVGTLYGQYDALNIATLASRIEYTMLDKIALALFVAGLAMKAGSVPMHMWVSDAYAEAPAPITMILVANSQASLYGIFRVCFTLYGLSISTYTVGWIIIVLGILSMFIGVTMALVQKKIKRLMAYHAISQTGYMLLGVGVGLAVLTDGHALNTYGIKAMEGGIFHIINHAMYKGLLFLTAGAVVYTTGKRNLNELGGLAHKMKFTAIFFIIGAAAIAGLPPFNGFASKLMIYESVYKFSPPLSVIAMIVSVLTLASFVKVFQSVFLGPKLMEVKKEPSSMVAAMFVLSAIVVLFGLFPDVIVDELVSPAVNALVNHMDYITAILGGV